MFNCSIVIATYNRNKILCNTIDSIRHSIQYTIEKYPKHTIDLIVIDQSTEHDSETTQYIEKIKNETDIKWINEKIANLPRARNIGVKNSEGDIIIFIDDDVTVEKEFIIEHLRNYDEEYIFGIAGKVVLANTSNENILLNAESKSKVLVKRILKAIFCQNNAGRIYDSGFMIYNFEKKKKCLTDGCKGCNMSFRKEVIVELGGFDENYENNAIREETDFCYRMKKKNYKLMYDPHVELKHIMENTGGCRNDKGVNYWQNYFNNQVYFYRKNFHAKLSKIKVLLIFDLINCKKENINYNNLLTKSWNRANKILGIQK